MGFDGRLYYGAAPIAPALHHPHAPAVGDLCGQALRASYLFAQHQATVIGAQTWPMRTRRVAEPVTINVSSLQRVAEWSAVHLGTHHTQLACSFMFSTAVIRRRLNMRTRLVVVVGANTDTGTTFESEVSEATADPMLGRRNVQGGFLLASRYFSTQCVIDLSTVVRPTEEAKVYLEAQCVGADSGVGTSSERVVPVHAICWRFNT